MKKYKTWEVVKTLEENPELSFQSKSKEWEMRVKDNKIVFTSKGLVCDICGIALNTEWTPIQQSVTFMEALNSGKRVYVEHEKIEKLKFQNCNCEDENICSGILIISNQKPLYIDKILCCLGWMMNCDELQEVINNGKWYIEE